MLKDLCFEVISHLCTAGTEKLDIKYDGTILPCPAFKEMSVKKMEKYGIKLHSIYEDLEKVVLHEGKRKLPLCKQVYGFNGELTESEEIEFWVSRIDLTRNAFIMALTKHINGDIWR